LLVTAVTLVMISGVLALHVIFAAADRELVGWWVGGWVGGWVDGWVGGWVGRWVGGWVGGLWVGGWVGGVAYAEACSILRVYKVGYKLTMVDLFELNFWFVRLESIIMLGCREKPLLGRSSYCIFGWLSCTWILASQKKKTIKMNF
jgi:hypothetical protein